jgi:D-3-phosphoglycerate dehydrogenase / 2-oxoglutarate reductase
MKVLVADNFEKSGLAGLTAAGCEVVYEPDTRDESLTEAIRSSGADVLVVRSTSVTASMLDSGRLSLIVRAGAGYNTIDVTAASKRGIYVSNCPGKNAIAVAELTFALMLALDRRIPDNVADLRAGKWNKKQFAKARGLRGQRLGILGVGSIAQEVIRRAAAFGLDVVLWSRRFDGLDRKMTEEDAQTVGLDETMRTIEIDLAPTPAAVAARADILSIHLAFSAGSKGLVGRDVLTALPDGAMLINTSRAEIVDQAALLLAVKKKFLRVGLDVFVNEPAAGAADFSDPLIALPGVYGTHHIGASTNQAQEAIAAETVRIVRSFKETGKVPNVVNLARRTPATHVLVVRHRDRPGVLAHVFDHLSKSKLNVQETENVVFDGAEAAVARINLDGAPARELCDKIKSGNSDVFDLHVVKL